MDFRYPPYRCFGLGVVLKSSLTNRLNGGVVSDKNKDLRRVIQP